MSWRIAELADAMAGLGDGVPLLNKGDGSMASSMRIDEPPRSTIPLPRSIDLELTVQDPEITAELMRHAEGEAREQFALNALRIGTLALRQAEGQVDQEMVRREGERLLEGLQSRLNAHSTLMSDRLSLTLKEYFDPEGGRFQERVNRLVQRDGELEQVLRRQIGDEDSELCRTLTSHFGDESPLMKVLDPTQTEGLLGALRGTLDEQLKQQRDHVLKQFSLDNREGALARFIVELEEHRGKLSTNLDNKINELVKEFSLDEEDSALSRLVRNVERAQRTITSEFSLDDDASALSRLKMMLESTNAAIHGHLSLDDEKSALARLKRELLCLLKDHTESNHKFQEEVKTALRAMQARREEAERSTRHGLEFEDAVYELLLRESQKVGDVAARTGNTTGVIRNCKVGDCVLQLGPDTAAAGAKIVVEAKEKVNYDLTAARAEIEQARKNREAQVGLFVFSRKTAPAGLDSLARYGDDVFVLWDCEDAATDLFLTVGLTLARALCVRTQQQQSQSLADFSVMNQAMLEIEKRAAGLADIETWTQTIQKRSEEILKKIRSTRGSLERQGEILTTSIGQLKEALTDG